LKRSESNESLKQRNEETTEDTICQNLNEMTIDSPILIKKKPKSNYQNLTQLELSLQKFTLNETLNEPLTCPNKKCSGHENKSKFTKQYLLYQLPPILTLHLKRFEQKNSSNFSSHMTRRSNQIVKCNKYVSFPLILNTSAFTSHKCVNTFMNNIDETNRNNLNYELYGLIEHSGKLNSGHYTAFVKRLETNDDDDDNSDNLKELTQRISHLKSISAEKGIY
jgi:ubiquitin C-terminal hydrolase